MKTTKNLNRMDLHLEYRSLPLMDVKFEHIDLEEYDPNVEYVLVDGDEYWECKILDPDYELMEEIDRQRFKAWSPFFPLSIKPE